MFDDLLVEWTRDALCHARPDLDWFASSPSKVAEAVAVCKQCPVMTECRACAIANRVEYGIWGGTTPTERRTVREHVSAVRCPP
jgi:WhiB family redox-sensing transcriptional regulator